jgi:histidinol-phosphatase (PHP family)
MGTSIPSGPSRVTSTAWRAVDASFPSCTSSPGVELGQPHLDEARARQLIDLDALDRVNGSLHTIPTTNEPGSVRSEPFTLYHLWPAEDVIRRYLAELIHMIAIGGTFGVVTHIEYAARYWPVEREGPFDPRRFKDGLGTRRPWSRRCD